ncbi:hypothetical protein EV356DRAFT_530522 [Viridothelium virens]|uniref:Signal recognition particle receptor subunit beta n=1 Tax=Viridothelium virens TaxID=1048519 RepID=A0A6A6HFY3_VIRVR|nr:hypothetical protein EV356DRAFT_530522 [Viridothelium virens]
MDLEGIEAFFTRGLSPLISTIIISAIIALSLPLFLHFYLYRSRTTTTVPSFLLLGPSGAGKTSLLTLLDRGNPTPTHTSQTPSTITCALPPTHRAASARFRSSHDPTSNAPQRFHLTDTPGHGKLRHFSLDALAQLPTALKGLIFVIDSAALAAPSAGAAAGGDVGGVGAAAAVAGGEGRGGGGGGASTSSSLTEAAEYLHDVLLVLQRRHTSAKTSRGPAALPVLIAANKVDLFTALPASLVKVALEREITRVRETRGKGLLDSGVDMGGEGQSEEEERDWLGGGEGDFRLEMMEECDVFVKVVSGCVLGTEGEKEDVEEWWEWIAENM